MTKYKAVPTIVDNVRFDSKRESERYQELKLLLRAGTIRNLELQPSFEIEINRVKICRYKADFRYQDLQGRTVVEDVKGMKSGAAYQMFKLKSKLVEAVHRIRILEI